MRVIAGKFKQMNIASPKAKNSMPTDNKVKEAVMDMLYPIYSDSKMLDLFSCTGQMGIEFLSRDISYVVFNEINKLNYKTLKENLSKTHVDNFKTYNNDFRKTLDILKGEDIKFDYIYLDPPYKTDYVELSLKLILKYDLLSHIGKIITEMDRDFDFSEKFDNLELIKSKKYGRKIIKIYTIK